MHGPHRLYHRDGAWRCLFCDVQGDYEMLRGEACSGREPGPLGRLLRPPLYAALRGLIWLAGGRGRSK